MSKMPLDDARPIKRMGQTELRAIDFLPGTLDTHLTYEVGPTGNIYDSHITSNLPGARKLSTK